LGWFQNDGIASRQSVIHLHDVQAVREVPRRQDRHDAQGLVAHQRLARADACDRPVAQLGGELGRAHGHVSGAVDLHHALVGGAAPLHLRQREELVVVLQQGIAQLVEAAGALLVAHAGPRPLVERPPRGRDRLADLGDARIGCGRDALFGGRSDVVVPTILRLDPSSVDVELVGVNEVGHLIPHPDVGHLETQCSPVERGRQSLIA
jgi:hypothetical protein